MKTKDEIRMIGLLIRGLSIDEIEELTSLLIEERQDYANQQLKCPLCGKQLNCITCTKELCSPLNINQEEQQ